jgi:hypothetical protein
MRPLAQVLGMHIYQGSARRGPSRMRWILAVASRATGEALPLLPA